MPFTGQPMDVRNSLQAVIKSGFRLKWSHKIWSKKSFHDVVNIHYWCVLVASVGQPMTSDQENGLMVHLIKIIIIRKSLTNPGVHAVDRAAFVSSQLKHTHNWDQQCRQQAVFKFWPNWIKDRMESAWLERMRILNYDERECWVQSHRKQWSVYKEKNWSKE